MSTILITGGNRGIGFEAAVQFGKMSNFSKIIISVRSAHKGAEAVANAAFKSGQPADKFDFQVLDLCSHATVRAAVSALPTLNAVVLNAGGLGGEQLTENGVTENFAMNVLGNVVLVEGLLSAGKIADGSRIVYSHSETTRSVWGFAGLQPFVKISKADIARNMACPPTAGSYGMPVRQRMNTYSNSKLIGGMWISILAQEHPDIYFVSMSPGGCADTNVYAEAPQPMSCLMGFGCTKHLMEFMGLCHPVEAAAKRYVTAVTAESFPERFPSGTVVGGPFMQICSKDGTLVDQSAFSPYYTDTWMRQEAARAVREKTRQ